MIIEKTGKLMGIRILINEQGFIKITLLVEFLNGIFMYNLKNSDFRKGFLINFLNDYDIGYSSLQLSFTYMDKQNKIALRSFVFENNNFILGDVIKNFPEDKKELILNLLDEDAISEKIDTNNFYTSKNMLNITGNCSFNGFIIAPEEYCDKTKDVSFYEVSNSVLKENIKLEANTIISYSNLWNNEGWNGPQNFGGIERISEDFINSGMMSYDFSNSYLESDAGIIIWDENTAVIIESSDEYGIYISTNLKNISYFLGISESDFIQSGIKEDFLYLSNVKYKTHQEYLDEYEYATLCLMSIEEVREHFNGYQEFMASRRNAILNTATTIKGAKA